MSFFRMFVTSLVFITTIATTAFTPASALATASPHASPLPKIVTYEIANYGSREDNLVVTFGSLFAPGDVPRGTGIEAVDSHDNELPLQLDRKATHPDGALRHGVITLVIPHLGKGEKEPVTIRRTTAPIDETKGHLLVSELPGTISTSSSR